MSKCYDFYLRRQLKLHPFFVKIISKKRKGLIHKRLSGKMSSLAKSGRLRTGMGLDKYADVSMSQNKVLRISNSVSQK